jgi:hypothetical protein
MAASGVFVMDPVFLFLRRFAAALLPYRHVFVLLALAVVACLLLVPLTSFDPTQLQLAALLLVMAIGWLSVPALHILLWFGPQHRTPAAPPRIESVRVWMRPFVLFLLLVATLPCVVLGWLAIYLLAHAPPG